MTYPPTPEQFLALPTDPEDDVETVELTSPLESIADSLRRLTALAENHDADESAEEQLRNDLVELEDAYRILEGQLDQVREICKPSTSKLANAIRAVLDPTAEEPAGDTVDLQPADDAPVEEWREYARGRGYQGPDVDQANRSQIRTMLGLPQPVAE